MGEGPLKKLMNDVKRKVDLGANLNPKNPSLGRQDVLLASEQIQESHANPSSEAISKGGGSCFFGNTDQ